MKPTPDSSSQCSQDEPLASPCPLLCCAEAHPDSSLQCREDEPQASPVLRPRGAVFHLLMLLSASQKCGDSFLIALLSST